MKSIRYADPDLGLYVFPFIGMWPSEDRNGQYVETPQITSVGSLSCAVRCLLSFSMKLHDITLPLRLEA